MSREKGDDPLAKVYERAQLSLSSAQRELETLRANLGLAGVRPSVAALAAGNTACDSGCDGGCGGATSIEAVINPAELKEKLTARVSAVLEAHKLQGTEALSKATAGNEACDSGCNSGCGGAKLGDLVTQPAAGASR